VAIAVVLGIFIILFIWALPKVIRAVRRMFSAVSGFFRGESFLEIARRAS